MKMKKKMKKKKKVTCLAVSNVRESINIHISLVACDFAHTNGARLASYHYLLHEIIVYTSTLS